MDEFQRRAQALLDDPPIAPTAIGELRQRARRRQRSRRLLAAGAVVIVAIAALGIAGSVDHGHSRRVLVENGDVRLPIGQSPTFVTSGAGAVWVLTTTTRADSNPGEAGTLLRVDPATESVVAAIELTGAPTEVAVDRSYAWVTLFLESAVAKIDLSTNQVVATIPLELPKPACSNNCVGATDFLPVHVAVGDGSAWVSTARGYVARIDAADNHVVTMIPTVFDETGSIVVTPTAVLVAQGNQPIARIDPLTNRVSKIVNPVDTDAGFAGAGEINQLFSSQTHPELGVWATAWLAGPEPAGAIGVNPVTGDAITANIGTGIRAVGVTDRVWAQADNKMFAISVNGGARTDQQVPIPESATIAIDDTSAWWITPSSSELTRTDLRGVRPETHIAVVEQAPTTSTTSRAQTVPRDRLGYSTFDAGASMPRASNDQPASVP